MFRIIFIFLFCIFIEFIHGANLSFTYILDDKAPTLYFDLRTLQHSRQLTVSVDPKYSLDMFLAGPIPSELDNFWIYNSATPGNNSLIGNLGNSSLTANYEFYITPFKYSSLSKVLTIFHFYATADVDDSVLFFRIKEIHGCGGIENVYQPLNDPDFAPILKPLVSPQDSSCKFTFINWKDRPRQLYIQMFLTSTTETIYVTGGIYKNEIDYFHFNQTTIDYLLDLNLYGSVINFLVPKNQTLAISYDKYDNGEQDPYTQFQTDAKLGQFNVITSPDYGEIYPIPSNHIATTIVESTLAGNCFLMEVRNRDESDTSVFTLVTDEPQPIDLKNKTLGIPFLINSSAITVQYSDSIFSNYRVLSRLLPCDRIFPPISNSSTSTTTISSMSTTISHNNANKIGNAFVMSFILHFLFVFYLKKLY